MVTEKDKSTLDKLFHVHTLEYYAEVVKSGNPRRVLHPDIKLEVDEAAAILKAYDHGLHGLDKSELQLINRVIGKLKDTIWP